MPTPQDINEFIKKQKKEYKDGAKSICPSCVRYNEDCFDAMKFCGKDEKSGWSTVVRCNKYKMKPATTAGIK